MKKLLVILALLLPTQLYATTYYVRSGGNNACNGTTNADGSSGACAWRTTDFASDTAVAGDTVRVQGTYIDTTTVTPGHSGTSGNTITFVADGTVTICLISADSTDSYLRWFGFVFNGTAAGCSSPSNLVTGGNNTFTGWEFWNNEFTNANGAINFQTTSGGTTRLIMIGNYIHNLNPVIGTCESGQAITFFGNDNLIAYNTITGVDYLGIVFNGVRNRFLNNYFSGFIQEGTCHPDFYYFSNKEIPTTDISIEGNFSFGTVTSTDNKGYHGQNETTQQWSRIRFIGNIWYQQGSGVHSTYCTAPCSGTGVALTFIANNDHLYCNRANNDPQYDNCGFISPATTAIFFNNIFYQAWSDASTSGVAVIADNNGGGQLTQFNNLAFDPNGSITFGSTWTSGTGELSNVDPSFVDVSNRNFSLQSGSSARAAGVPYTTTSGSGTGTTFTVSANGGIKFRGDNSSNLPAWGGALVPGDIIVVGGDTVQIVSISGNDITVGSSFTWLNGESVYLAENPNGDLGAKPYKSSYTLTGTYTNNAGTVTITPSDTSLVRFTTCSDDGIVTSVDNTAPFTCTAGSGTLVVKMYSKFASETLTVNATDAGTTNSFSIRRFLK